jgi:hypothetical protein
VRAVSVDYRAPAVPETARAQALLERCFRRNPVDRPSAGDLAGAYEPDISGTRDIVTALCEENDRLKAAYQELEAKLKASEATSLRNAEEKIRIEDGIAVLYQSLHLDRGHRLVPDAPLPKKNSLKVALRCHAAELPQGWRPGPPPCATRPIAQGSKSSGISRQPIVGSQRQVVDWGGL